MPRIQDKEMITVGELFAGIGGIGLGLEMTGGFEVKWQVELDKYARKILEKNWPNAARWDDVCTFPPDEGEWSVEMITGGFPCQDISTAGKRKGLDGERSGLFYEIMRIAKRLRPKYLVLENVAAITVAGRGMDRVLRELAEVGFDAEWHCIPAAAVGAPHRRDRLFIIAYAQHARPYRYGKDEQKCQCEEMERCELTGRNGRDRDVADSTSVRLQGQGESEYSGDPTSCCEGETIESIYGRFHHIWSVEPEVGRVVDGFPGRVDQLRCLGNAVVPQIAQFLGEKILELENVK